MDEPEWSASERSRENAFYERYCSGHLQHERERPDMERKYMNSDNWQDLKQRGRVNNLVKWDRGWWHKYTKQTSSRSPISIVIEDSG